MVSYFLSSSLIVIKFKMEVLDPRLTRQFLVIQPQQERVYTSYLQLDLADVEPCVSGPKRYALCHLRSTPLFYLHLLSSLLIRDLLFVNRPHDRVSLKEMKADWHACLDNQVGFKVGCN